MIFVDTSAWFAIFVPTDDNHPVARPLFDALPSKTLITTDYILAETLTLFKMRRETRRVFQFGQQILEGRICRLSWIEPTDIYRAWIVFDSYRDKGWSFTDCVSRAVMERLEIKEAFAFDDHFREFGDVTVLP